MTAGLIVVKQAQMMAMLTSKVFQFAVAAAFQVTSVFPLSMSRQIRTTRTTEMMQTLRVGVVS